jgi:hypothetical protein
MKLYFAGAEIPSHRKVLTTVEADNAALSFMGLRRRIKHPENWHLADKFPEGMGLLLDSGAFTVNKDPMAYTQGDLKEISESYRQFVQDNVERVDAFIEFDAMALGREWIEDQRASLSELAPEKFMPVWHPEWGVNYLQELAETYQNIGIPSTDISGRNLAPVLNGIAGSGVNLHGVAMTHVDEMREIRWHSVSSTSWVSPQQYGDTIVWTGRELKRYPKKSKDQARKRYRTLFEREGFDAEAIANDDSSELLRLSIWSWEKLVDDIEHKSSRPLNLVTNPPEEGDERFAEFGGELVDTHPDEERNSVPTLPSPKLPVRRRDQVALPVLGSTTETVKDEETGEDKEVTSYHIRSESERVCDSCFLANKCPAFEPGSNCAYNIPLQIRTRTEYQRTYDAMVEMQTQRVMFMRFAEDLEGGYADPNLSSELDRLTKMMKVKNDMDSDTFSVRIEGKSAAGGGGSMGVIGRLFGDKASQRAQELPAPVDVEQVFEGEVIDDGGE